MRKLFALLLIAFSVSQAQTKDTIIQNADYFPVRSLYNYWRYYGIFDYGYKKETFQLTMVIVDYDTKDGLRFRYNYQFLSDNTSSNTDWIFKKLNGELIFYGIYLPNGNYPEGEYYLKKNPRTSMYDIGYEWVNKDLRTSRTYKILKVCKIDGIYSKVSYNNVIVVECTTSNSKKRRYFAPNVGIIRESEIINDKEEITLELLDFDNRKLTNK